MSGHGTGMGALERFRAAGMEVGNTGQQMAGNIAMDGLAQRAMYARPSAPDPEEPANDVLKQQGYNLEGAYPVKYSTPTLQKERMVARQEVREAASEGGVATIRTDPITEDETNYLMEMKATAKLADFDRYVSTLVDPRSPADMAWLSKLYPEFQQRRIAQAHADYQFAIKEQMIDSWGIQTFDDLLFRYMVDQGELTGPSLAKREPAGEAYTASMLSPWAWQTKRPAGIRAPYAMAKTGKSPGPGNENNWLMRDSGQAFGKVNGPELAKQIYKQPGTTS